MEMNYSSETGILYGGPAPVDICAGYSNLGDFITEKLRENGDQVALINGKTSEAITYSGLLRKCDDILHCLRINGIEGGDVIGLMCENSLDFSAVALAAFNLGARLLLINVTYKENELQHVLKLAPPKIIFISPFASKVVANVLEEDYTISSQVVIFGNDNIFNINGILFNQFLKTNISDSYNIKTNQIKSLDDVCLINCSSGTTGLPKGVEITQRNIQISINNASLNFNGCVMDNEEITSLLVLPFTHVYGFMLMLTSLLFGNKLIFLSRFEEDLFLSCIENYRVTRLPVVPPLMVLLAKSHLVNKYDLSSLKEIFSAAAPLSVDVENAVRQRIGVKYIIQCYGMSETAFNILFPRRKESKSGSVGNIQYGAWVKVMDIETGEILGPYQKGELCFKSPALMKGYLNNEEATRHTIRNGWLHSGDIGYYDEDAMFFVIDRLKELIKYKGCQVSPTELESILLTNKNIRDAAVIGLPDEEACELPLAFIVPTVDSDITEDEIISYIAERMSPAKRLRGGVRFVSSIPKNSSGKILRRLLRAIVTSEVNT